MCSSPPIVKTIVVLAALTGALAAPRIAAAQDVKTGFAVNRYEPTAAGEWSFWVDHPWYSSTRYFSAGITLNYGHNPLVFGRVAPDGTFMQSVSVIEHQLIGHVDLAGSFLDRILITGSVPITFLERGTPAAGAEPANGVAAGDPRIGVWARLFGQPYRSAISMSLGAQVWLPLRTFGATSGVAYSSGDDGVRVLPKLALGGLAKHILWSFTGGFLYRPAARIGVGVTDAGSTVGSEVQLGAAIAYADWERRFAVGPELVFGTQVLGTDAVQPFSRNFTSLEVLLGAHYNIARQVNLGVAGGVGLLRTPGTPDGRVLLRLAYAPMKQEKKKIVDRDGDGILDTVDACPEEAGIATSDARTHGCPDRDRDGVVDPADLCPDTPKGSRPDPNKLGCPIGDKDGDGVLDPDDLCPETPKGDHPDPAKLGCPAGDRDKDGVLDPDDLCIDTPKGDKPDPNKLGCPAGDRDKDTVVDPEDACPDQPGAPDTDPKKNGCPGQTLISGGQIKIIEPVFFATNKDIILKRSYPVLESVATTLKATPSIKKVAVEGHTDNKGRAAYNRDLSARRAQSVVRFLVEKGIAEGRLQSAGFGPDKPIADNKTAKGREKNRRVDFVIVDPAQPADVQVKGASEVVVPPSEDQSDGNDKGRHHRRHKGKKSKHEGAETDKTDTSTDASAPGEKRHHRRHKKGDPDKTDTTDKAGESDADAGGEKKHHRRHKKADKSDAADDAKAEGKKKHHRRHKKAE